VNENVWGKQKKKRRLPLSLDRNILSFVLFFSYEKKNNNRRTLPKIIEFYEYYIAKKNEIEKGRERELCVCVCGTWNFLLLTQEGRQQL
jgi:hypothetical protein